MRKLALDRGSISVAKRESVILSLLARALLIFGRRKKGFVGARGTSAGEQKGADHFVNAVDKQGDAEKSDPGDMFSKSGGRTPVSRGARIKSRQMPNIVPEQGIFFTRVAPKKTGKKPLWRWWGTSRATMEKESQPVQGVQDETQSLRTHRFQEYWGYKEKREFPCDWRRVTTAT